MFGWRQITQLCTTRQSVLLSLSAAAEYYGKHQPFWIKFSPQIKPQSKPLAAHMFTCLCVTRRLCRSFPFTGIFNSPSLPSWKCAIYFSPSTHPSETNLQAPKGQTGLCFNLIFNRLAASSSSETLLPLPALGFIPS